jgi:hypothetical protein
MFVPTRHALRFDHGDLNVPLLFSNQIVPSWLPPVLPISLIYLSSAIRLLGDIIRLVLLGYLEREGRGV